MQDVKNTTENTSTEQMQDVRLDAAPTSFKFTAQEQETFDKFISRSVIENVGFPNNSIGTQNITVQELLHNKNVKSLTDFGKFIEKNYVSSGSMFDKGSEKNKPVWGSITGLELVMFVMLAVKYKEYISDSAKRERALRVIDAEIATFKTPEERKAELLAKKAALQAGE